MKVHQQGGPNHEKIKWIIPTLALMLAIGGSYRAAASAEKNLVDSLPFDPADREKQVVYISTLGELLSYTFDFFDGNGTMYLQYKLYNEYSVFFNFGNFGKTYTASNNHGKTQNADPAACNKMQKQEQNIKCLNFEKIKYRCRDWLKNLL